MSISEQSQAVLLLTAWFTKPSKGEAKPLTPKEWGRFALWLKEQGLSPVVLLRASDVTATLSKWSDKTVSVQRIRDLLERAGALGIALEKWQRAGLWVMTRSDPDYPARLKRRLKTDAPPVLFGSGSRQLLDQGGIAVVGARNASEEDLTFTARLGQEIALQGRAVVSGGARGVDETAMLGALDHEGTAIGILADSLLRASNSAKYRRALMDKNLVLVSPFNPEAGFDVGNAMARNKYIYCLSDAAVIVSATEGKGGTWTGAVEALKHAWVPTWVMAHLDPQSGNAALIQMGARLLEAEPSMDVLVSGGEVAQSPPATASAPVSQALDLDVQSQEPIPQHLAESVEAYPVAEASISDAASGPRDTEAKPDLAPMSLYDHFLAKLAIETRDEPLSTEMLQEKLQIHKYQVAEWLKRGIADGQIEKVGKPACYHVAKPRLL